ncbi:hypothetical protein WG904_09885 [Pedobacter sp. Du54]|uniref:hypothetical protein n=1 Tax=Pedobacter anseongensis TaxID=3133439 RepID=UPI00309B5742
MANYFQWSIANHKVLASLLYLTALTLCWIGLVRLPARKKKIRYMGFSPHNLLFLGISFILILLAFSTSNTLKEKPKKILSVSGILDNPKEKLFYIQHTNYNPKQTLLYRPIIKNRSKSNKLSVDHIFVTPITNSNQKEPIQPINFWITKTYTQSIPKAIPAVSKESMIKEFGLQSRVKLINQLQEKPEFYKILYNQLNLTKSHDQAYELIKSSQIFNSTAIILEPHWETLSVYKDELRLKIFWLLMGVLLFNGICAIAIAINR